MITKRLCKKNNVGFTLAEILIAMLIAGILAAVIMPLISRMMPNANRVAYKKAVGSLSKAVDSMINDDVLYVNAANGFHDTTATASCTAANKFGCLMAEQMNVVGQVDYGTAGWARFTTTDGMRWSVSIGPTVGTCVTGPFPVTEGTCRFMNKVVVDVNGAKDPNCTADTGTGGNWGTIVTYRASCTNPDQFIIGVSYDGILQTACSTLPVCNGVTDTLANTYLSAQTNVRKY